MEKSETYLEVEILFKDGTKDWVSPIDNIKRDVRINDTDELLVTNCYYTYTYQTGRLSKVDIVKMFDHEEIERESLYNFE